jgi:hypothetical protein
MSKAARGFLIIGLCLAVSRPLFARECEGVRLPNQVDVEGANLSLVGMGIREATALNVDVYVAGLYLESPTRDARQVIESQQKKRLVLSFVRDVDASDIAEAFCDGFRENAGGGLAALQARLRRLNSWLPAVTTGSRLVFTYVPGTGIQVQVGGRVKGVIEGDDFARVFFSIWFGANPPNAGLKRGLLGGECG